MQSSMSRTVELRIGGQSYRVVSSAPEEELQRLAAVVNRKLSEVAAARGASSEPLGGRPPPQGLLLVAIALAHEVESLTGQVEQERDHRRSLEDRVRGLLGGILTRIDGALSPNSESASE
jgi:cell division protein ZapA